MLGEVLQQIIMDPIRSWRSRFGLFDGSLQVSEFELLVVDFSVV